jgi:anti-anti-sigma factor
MIDGMSGAPPAAASYRPPRFDVTSEDADGTVLLKLSGELDLVGEPVLAQALAKANGHPVLIDLSEVAFMDSTGLRALLEGNRRAEAAGGALTLRVRPEGPVARLLDIAGVAGLFGSA